MDNATFRSSIDSATKLLTARRLPEAEALLRQVLAAEPNEAVPLHLMGVCLHQMGRTKEGLEFVRRAVQKKSGEPEFRNSLGVLAMGLGLNEEAEMALRRAISLRPSYATAHQNLGQLMTNLGRPADAIAAYRTAVQVAPKDSLMYVLLGGALLSVGMLDEGVGALNEAVKLNPKNADAFNLLGNAMMMKGEPNQAIEMYRRSANAMPTFAGAWSNLGNALQQTGKTEEAFNACIAALKHDPNLADAHNNIGNTLKDMARLDEACAHYQRAVALRPQTIIFFTNLVYAMWFRQACDPAEVLRVSKEGARVHFDPLTPRPAARFDNDRTPGKRIKVGYISGDFRSHPVGRFMLPLVANHNKGQVDVTLFSNIAKPDSMSQRIYAPVDKIIKTNAMNDDMLAHAIRQEKIDILIDLSLHMAGTRLQLFARKPAPVQMTYLAYCATSGIEAMDYCITDVNLDPVTSSPAPGQAGIDSPLHSEQLLHLPTCYWCYMPPDEAQPVNALPAEKNGFITFGSFNSFTKLNGGVFDLWAELMRAVPRSRLNVVVPGGPARQNDVRNAMAQRGVSGDRLSMGHIVSVPEYFQMYSHVDMTLDPFPYAGGTTTMDSLWMGCPCVTLEGKWALARAGVTILKNAGHPEWITQTPGQYIEVAKAIAGDVPALAELRRTLRDRLQASELMNGPRFGRDMEGIYRRAWDKWCVSGGKYSVPV